MVIVLLLICISWPPRVFLWDNDGGQSFDDPELQTRVGVETNLIRAMNYIGINPDIDTRLPDSATLAGYDVLFVVNGWRGGDFILENDRNTIKSYLNNGHCVYMEGNNVAYNYTTIDPDFILRFGAYSHFDGNPQGNADSIIGVENTPTEGLRFDYPYTTPPDSSMDDIMADESYGGQADTFFMATGRGKAYWGAAVGYGFGAFKSTPYRTITTSFVFGALRSTGSIPDSVYRAIYLLRVFAYFGWQRILLVRDDPNTNGNYYDSYVLEGDLSSLDKPYQTYTVPYRGNGPDFDFMSRFAVVIWGCGDENAYTLLDGDCSSISSYLFYGGRIILIGDSIAPDLAQQGNLSFLVNYFRVEYVQQATSSPSYLYGMGFLGSLSSPYDPRFGQYPSILDSITPSFPVFRYDFSRNSYGGISYRYIDEGRPNGGRSTFFGFPWTGIDLNTDRVATLDSLLKFSGGNTYLYASFVNMNAQIFENVVIVRIFPSIPLDCRVVLKRYNGDEERMLMETVYKGSPIEYVDRDVKKNASYTYLAGVEVNGSMEWKRVSVTFSTGDEDLDWNIQRGVLRVPKGMKFRIIDLSGRVVIYAEKVGNMVNLRKLLPSGVYFFCSENGTKLKKLTVIK